MKRLILLQIAILMSMSSIFAQSRSMSGVVVDEQNIPMAGVSVLEEGTNNGVFTDVDGRFFINVAGEDSRLVLDFLGYSTLTVPFSAKHQVISMYPAYDTVEEVVVVAYGTQKKHSVVGSISSASSEDLKQMGTPNLSNALAGVVSGITFTVPSGQPGLDDASIYIRGISTFSGDSAPLVLVDGVERDFSQVDPEDIAQLSVLKDASATAVYGVRGANGAILITTKRGTKNTPKLSLSYSLTLQQPTRMPDFLGSYDHAILRNEALANDGSGPAFSPEDIELFRTGASPYTHPDNDYVNDFIRTVSPMHKLNVGVRGGSEKVRYYVALSGISQSGMYKQFADSRYDSNAGYKRINLRANLDFSLTPTTDLSLDLNGRLENRRNIRGSDLKNDDLFENMYTTPPMFYPYTLPDGSYGIGSQATINLLALMKDGGYTSMNTNSFEGTIKLNQRFDFITPGLSARAVVSFNSYFDTGTSITYTPAYYKYIPGATADDWTKEEASPESNPSISSMAGNGHRQRLNVEAAVDYNRSFGNHTVTGLLLFNINRTTRNANLPQAFIGYAARATYSYKDKYLVEANVGYNGSDQFAEGKRYAFFPSFAVGYVLTNEDFMKNVDWLSYLKVRASYGMVGNDKIGSDRFLYLQVYDKHNNGYFFGTDTAFGGQASLTEGALGNENVTWEIGKKTNIGVEMSFFNALDVKLDFFDEHRENIFTARNTTPQTLGVASAKENIGRVMNRGFEVEASYTNKFSNGLVWRIGGMFSYSRNKVLYKDEVEPKFEYLRQTGQPINQFFGYTVLGYYLPTDFIEVNGERVLNPELPQPALGAVVQPGDFKYKDLNNDNVIDTYDRGPIGFSKIPQIVYNFNSTLKYKNFDFSFMFQGVSNVSKLMTKSLYEPQREKGTFQTIHLYRWTEERWKNGEDIRYPRLSSNTNNHNQTTNTFFLADGSYLRLKNIELGYTFNKKQLALFGLQSLRIYVSGNNLLTISEIKNFDPELGDSNGYFYPQMKQWNFGVNINF